MCDLPFRPNDDSAEGFTGWEFMTTHCWGERPAGRWTLEIHDRGSQERERAEPGLHSVFVTSRRCERCRRSLWSGPSAVQASGDEYLILSSLSFACRLAGALKEWSLVIYGTAAPPRPAHAQRARSAERESQMENDFVGGYEGQSRSAPENPLYNWMEVLALQPGWGHGVMGSCSCQLFSFQDLVTRNAATAAARGPARTAASHVCTFSSSSRTTQGELRHGRGQTNTASPSQPPASLRQDVRVPVSQGVLGRPPAVQKMLLHLRELHRKSKRPVHLLSRRSSSGGGRHHVHGRLRGRLLPGPR